MPAEGTRMAGLWEREVGRLRPKRFANSVMASQDFVQSLSIQRKLQKHTHCINTVSFNSTGSLLLSGSDDMTLVLWNWEEGTPTTSFHTGHGNNVIHAQFMPLSDDRSIIMTGSDGEVKHLQIQEGGHVVMEKLVEMDNPVHRLAVELGSPHKFYSCGEDGSVWHFDLRGKEATKLFSCASVNSTPEITELYAIAMDPRNPCCFAVSGTDEYVRLYDSRKSYVNGNSPFGCPVDYFCPPELIGQHKDGITGLAFSQSGEMLASYSYDNIYLFQREHGLLFNGFKVGEMLEIGEAATFTPSFEKLLAPQTFKGHQNMQTVKGVSFLGSNYDFVASGSDCGHIFIWRKKDGVLMRVMKGSKRIVNCVEQHPYDMIVASSGMDKSIKIWAPGASEDPSMAASSIAHEVKKLNWFERTIMCMNVDIRKEQYEAYRERRELLNTQQLMLHHVTGSTGSPPKAISPLSYDRWNSSSQVPWVEIEKQLYGNPTATSSSRTPDHEEESDEEEEDSDDDSEEIEYSE